VSVAQMQIKIQAKSTNQNLMYTQQRLNAFTIPLIMFLYQI